ncbi:MAG: hypothetical protein COX48_02400 [bacterium (Candidatus Stahlbacteria) CG23_combo_of_CG06-09_8_20_14_all_34_7]|nr:MAG: hypothetical protein COX48_02400 [bacterium (Candidatus Stahlbacteria) CG23_combo_of_CG06-09_8_20_14_all_34_7]
MRFPRGRAILENTNIDFVNFDNILNAGKKERSHKIHGYISIIYSQEVDIIFLSLGEPINAAKFHLAERTSISISDAINKVKKASVGILNIYEVPEELVLMIISTLHLKPVFKLKSVSEISPEKIIEQLSIEKFTGFLEIKKGSEMFYTVIEKGIPTRGYFADKLNVQVSPSLLITILKAVANDGTPVLFSLYDELPKRIEQATPAIVQMILKSTNAIIREFALSYGPTFAKKGLFLAKNHINEEYEFMKDFSLVNIEVSGDTMAPKDEFVKAFAEFINRFMKTYDIICKDDVKEKVFRQALKDFRFALKSIGYYNYSIFKDE